MKKVIEYNDSVNLDIFDAWLVAYCLETGYTLVTQEIPVPNQKNRIKIPDVCDAFDVNYSNMIRMFRDLQVRFQTHPSVFPPYRCVYGGKDASHGEWAFNEFDTFQ